MHWFRCSATHYSIIAYSMRLSTGWAIPVCSVRYLNRLNQGAARSDSAGPAITSPVALKREP